ncbi:MAG: hypothetical protein BMS9Abin29_0415 [Gemmatimonadota bacterium]|nr:MAG: hypothetical protein BMS9Abin29_0415 [Gemmatimonadota bacterium]
MDPLTGSETGPRGDRQAGESQAGFALALVVLLLFAIAVAGATGYQVVHGEWRMAVQSTEGQTALGLSRAGLQRFMAEQIGVFADTVTYSLNGGDAIVIARKIADINDFSSLYLVSSEGVYSDPVSAQLPARRTVYQYAVRKKTSVDWAAAITQSSGTLTIEPGAHVAGGDISTILDCPDGGGPAIAGVARGGNTVTFNPTDVSGNPDSISYGSHASVLSAMDISWGTLTDPAFPVDFQDVWASGLPVDSFPVVRFTGDKIGYGWTSGRGLLIVTGSFEPQWGFTWDGVILTANFDPMVGGSSSQRAFNIRGVLLSGLDGLGTGTFINSDGSVDYHRCNVIRATGAHGHFRPIGNSWWESM